MTLPRNEDGNIRMSYAEFEDILTRAAEDGARRALADVGLDHSTAYADVHDLKTLLAQIRVIRTTATQTAVRVLTTAVILALLAGLLLKLKLLGLR